MPSRSQVLVEVGVVTSTGGGGCGHKYWWRWVWPQVLVAVGVVTSTAGGGCGQKYGWRWVWPISCPIAAQYVHVLEGHSEGHVSPIVKVM